MANASRFRIFSAVSVCLWLLAACANQREPARKIMEDIEAAVSAASAEAAKYLPDRLNDVQTKVGDLESAFTAKDYQSVLLRGPALMEEAQGLASAAAAKKAQKMQALDEEWTSLASTVPPQTSAIQSRIEMLEQRKNRKLAKDIDLGAAKSGFDQATSRWSKAQGAFGNGNLDEAVAAGREAKEKLESVADALRSGS